MANYYASSRTNYFKVAPKKQKAFDKWAKELRLEVCPSSLKPGLICLLPGDYTDSGAFPSCRENKNKKTGDLDEFDFAEELSKFLADESVVIIMEAGAEKLRYIHGHAIAINNKGRSAVVSLMDIYQKAKKLGKDVTECMY